MGRRIFFLFVVFAVSLLNTGVAGVLFEKFDSNHSTIGFTVPIMGGLSEGGRAPD